MLIAARHLLDRVRHVRSRADEVAELRRRLAAQPTQVSDGEAGAARELRALRERLSSAIGPVQACRGCARGHPEPHGHWEGGHCCGARTEDLFNDDEIGALRLGGTRPGRLTPPAGDHAGCAFRGPRGCSLAAADRPNVCVRYVCPDLARELHARGDLPQVEALCARMEEVYLRFIRLRGDRLADEELSGRP